MTTDAEPGAAEPSRAPRRKSFRPSFQRGRAKQWDPAKVGTSRGYPKTAEGYERRRQAASERAHRLNAEGRLTRRGVPDGWSGRGEELAAVRAAAEGEAAEMVAALKAADVLGADESRAEIALEYVLSVVRNLSESASARGIAARTALTFLKARPAARMDVAASPAENVLTMLARAAA
jgi:hypothetical protein